MKKRKETENEEIIKDMIEKQCAKKKREDDKKRGHRKEMAIEGTT
jgi:hypothetical protein